MPHAPHNDCIHTEMAPCSAYRGVQDHSPGNQGPGGGWRSDMVRSRENENEVDTKASLVEEHHPPTGHAIHFHVRVRASLPRDPHFKERMLRLYCGRRVAFQRNSIVCVFSCVACLWPARRRRVGQSPTPGGLQPSWPKPLGAAPPAKASPHPDILQNPVSAISEIESLCWHIFQEEARTWS